MRVQIKEEAPALDCSLDNGDGAWRSGSRVEGKGYPRRDPGTTDKTYPF